MSLIPTEDGPNVIKLLSDGHCAVHLGSSVFPPHSGRGEGDLATSIGATVSVWEVP